MILAAVGILAIIGVAAYQNEVHTSEIAAAAATPTPNGATRRPISLVDGEAIGIAALPNGDTPQGGQGQNVHDIQCAAQEYLAFHIHAHLALFVDGNQMRIPAQIGFPTSGKQCLYWLHTHDASGIVHVESPLYRSFTLGDFFDIWGEPLTKTRVATFAGPVHAFVNGALDDGELRSIPLSDHQQITLEVGTRLVPPPTYAFPAGDR